jgi:uncharacterized membrane protein (DUF4010 family)
MESIISFYSLASAIGLGLLIGAVRERAQPDPQHTVAGIRTHLMVALAGALGAALGTVVLVTMLVLIGALTVASYIRNSDGDPGLTGEVALPVTALLAAVAYSRPAFAAGLAVVVAGVLFAKRPLHQLVRERVSEQEVRDGLLLAGAALVVLPMLPSHAIDPWGALVPAKLWRMVVLILAVGMAGHVASRVVGARWGLPVAGFFSGFASSTAAVIGFGHRAREEPAHVGPAAAGALFANLGSLAFFAAVVGAASPALLREAAPGLGAAALALTLVALTGIVRGDSLANLPEIRNSRAFQLRQAFLLVGLIALLLVASAILRTRFDGAGTMVAASVVAVAEVQAAAASVAQLAAEGQLQIHSATWGLVLLLLVAGIAKAMAGFATGGASYGWRVSIGLAAVPVAFAAVLLGSGGSP